MFQIRHHNELVNLTSNEDNKPIINAFEDEGEARLFLTDMIGRMEKTLSKHAILGVHAHTIDLTQGWGVADDTEPLGRPDPEPTPERDAAENTDDETVVESAIHASDNE